MYTSSQIGINEITNLYLYGTTTKAPDLTSTALIRPAAARTTIEMDAVSFMATGPGRFANASSILAVKAFMDGGVFAANGQRQVFSLSSAISRAGTESANTKIAQSDYQDGTDDHAFRTYVYQSSGFTLAQGATFVIEADGTRHIQDLAILPFDDNFDFESNAPLSAFGNSYLKPRIDPTGIGRRVNIVIDPASKTQVIRIDYTSSTYMVDRVRQQQSFTPIGGTAKLITEMPQIVADLWTQGITKILDQEGRFVLHGSASADNLGPSRFDNAALYSPLRAALNEKGIALIASGGGDTLTGGIRGDYLNGGDDNDTLTGGKGDDILIGGKGDDLYIYNTGDGNDRIIEERDADGRIHGRIRVNDLTQDLNATGLFIQQSSQQTWAATDGSQITLTHNSPWTVHFADGSTIDLGEDFQSGDFGIRLYEETSASTTFVRTILGDLAPMDFDPTTTGVQARIDDLGNIITDPDKPVPNQEDRLSDSAGNDLISGGGGFDFIDAWRGGNDRLDGGAGDDIVLGRDGDDIVIGGAGMDLLRGDVGQDKLYAGSEVTLEAALAAQDDAASGIRGDFIDASEGSYVFLSDPSTLAKERMRVCELGKSRFKSKTRQQQSCRTRRVTARGHVADHLSPLSRVSRNEALQ